MINNITETKDYKNFIKKQEKELNFLFSPVGIELQLCLISQGYEDKVFYRLLCLFGSGFSAIKILRSLREDYL